MHGGHEEGKGKDKDKREAEAAELSTPRTPRFISRTEWKAEEPEETPNTREFWPEWGGIVIHYTGGGDEMMDKHDWDPRDPWHTCYGQVILIQRKQMHPWPVIGGEDYSDIAYNYLVCRHGYTFVGRGLMVQPGANGSPDPKHPKWNNERYYAICGLLGSENKEPPQAMLDEIKAVADWVRTNDQAGARIEGRHVKGHRELGSSDDCPGSLYPYIGKGYFD
nr:peptidoglycan recognition family protein [Streptomyces coryli]